MNDRDLLFELMFRAMIEIRADAFENKSAKAFRLADLFHNFPKEMSSQVEEQEILRRLRDHARMKGIESWLAHALAEIEKSAMLKSS